MTRSIFCQSAPFLSPVLLFKAIHHQMFVGCRDNRGPQSPGLELRWDKRDSLRRRTSSSFFQPHLTDSFILPLPGGRFFSSVFCPHLIHCQDFLFIVACVWECEHSCSSVSVSVSVCWYIRTMYFCWCACKSSTYRTACVCLCIQHLHEHRLIFNQAFSVAELLIYPQEGLFRKSPQPYAMITAGL